LHNNLAIRVLYCYARFMRLA